MMRALKIVMMAIPPTEIVVIVHVNLKQPEALATIVTPALPPTRATVRVYALEADQLAATVWCRRDVVKPAMMAMW